MKRLLALILSTMYSVGCLAQVTYLKKDQPSPSEGYLFTLDAELQNRMKLEQLKTLLIVQDNDQQILALKDQYIKDSDNQVTLWKAQSQDLSKQLIEQQNTTFWHSILYFGLGVVSATAMAFAVSRATR